MIDPLEVMTRYDGRVPVPVFDILGDLGLGPEFRRLDDDVSGWIERKQDGAYHVVINASHPLTRQRFTAAHELGHYLYHRTLLGAGVGDTRAYRAAKSPKPNPLIQPMHERQANSFAANILMPLDEILRETQGDPLVLANRFGVSQDAMRIRLGIPREN